MQICPKFCELSFQISILLSYLGPYGYSWIQFVIINYSIIISKTAKIKQIFLNWNCHTTWFPEKIFYAFCEQKPCQLVTICFIDKLKNWESAKRKSRSHNGEKQFLKINLLSFYSVVISQDSYYILHSTIFQSQYVATNTGFYKKRKNSNVKIKVHEITNATSKNILPPCPFSRNFLLIYSPNYLVYWSRIGNMVKISH